MATWGDSENRRGCNTVELSLAWAGIEISRRPLVETLHRQSDDLQDEIRMWAEEHDDLPLAAAIRRLVEVGLKVKK
jgi:hypothetical protein